ncbi:MAG: aminotransferase class I/II-fold pyridoxal phosphate-dependent enzyme [Agathobacter sp.]|nr:aminotransferase class I/II-fold pyridoxal phosphate-dependent enzyme [Agathobacter sp.]MCR5678449.1 aminotransferase class I/II-fold pyridoxal phosphate-dependent enzyme [Agathobacter sp.]
MPERNLDFDDFENKIKENQVKLFILCNPHNPVGRVWTKKKVFN